MMLLARALLVYGTVDLTLPSAWLNSIISSHLFETLSQPIAASNSFGGHNDGRTGMMAKQAKFFKESRLAACHSWGWTMNIWGSGLL